MARRGSERMQQLRQRYEQEPQQQSYQQRTPPRRGEGSQVRRMSQQFENPQQQSYRRQASPRRGGGARVRQLSQQFENSQQQQRSSPRRQQSPSPRGGGQQVGRMRDQWNDRIWRQRHRQVDEDQEPGPSGYDQGPGEEEGQYQEAGPPGDDDEIRSIPCSFDGSIDYDSDDDAPRSPIRRQVAEDQEPGPSGYNQGPGEEAGQYQEAGPPGDDDEIRSIPCSFDGSIEYSDSDDDAPRSPPQQAASGGGGRRTIQVAAFDPGDSDDDSSLDDSFNRSLDDDDEEEQQYGAPQREEMVDWRSKLLKINRDFKILKKAYKYTMAMWKVGLASMKYPPEFFKEENMERQLNALIRKYIFLARRPGIVNQKGGVLYQSGQHEY